MEATAQLSSKYHLGLESLLRRAADFGVDFGIGNKAERLRYLVKLGLISHPLRVKDPNHIARRGAPPKVLGMYPPETLGRLVAIDRLVKSGRKLGFLTAEEVGQYVARLAAVTPALGEYKEHQEQKEPQLAEQSPQIEVEEPEETGYEAPKWTPPVALWSKIGLSEGEIEKRPAAFEQKFEDRVVDLEARVTQAIDSAAEAGSGITITESDLAIMGGYCSKLEKAPDVFVVDSKRQSDIFISDTLRGYPWGRVLPALVVSGLILAFVVTVKYGPKVTGLQLPPDNKSQAVASAQALNLDNLGQVLAASTTANNLYIDATTQVKGETTFLDNITAPNVVYGVTGGTGIAVTAGQNPVVSLNAAELVSSVNSISGALSIAAGSNTTVSTSGSTITISSSSSSSSSSSTSGVTSITAGTGLTGGGSTSTVTLGLGIVPVSLGGLGAAVAPAGAGEVLYSASTTTYGTLAAGVAAQCLLSGGAAAPTWGACDAGGGVTSVTGTANQITADPTTGAVVLTLPAAITAPGSLTTTTTLTATTDFNVNGNTTIGNATTDRLTVTSQILGASPLVFQGLTDDAFTTTFAITDPTTPSKTITFPDATGTVAVSATSPITLSALGDIGCSTCLVSGGSLWTAGATSGTTTQAVLQGGTLTFTAGTDITTTGTAGVITIADTATLATVTSRGATTTTLVNLDGGIATDTSNFTVSGTTGAIVTASWIQSTLATGTAPLVIASTTLVTNLNADLLDGLDSTAFGDATAANQVTILTRIGTNVDAAGTTTLFARLASIDTTKVGTSSDTSANATLFGKLSDVLTRIGTNADAAGTTTLFARLASIDTTKIGTSSDAASTSTTLFAGQQYIADNMGTAINSIQRGTIITETSGTTATATITSVNTAKSILYNLGWVSLNSGTGTATNCYLTLTNATTVTATCGASIYGGSTVAYEVVEYK